MNSGGVGGWCRMFPVVVRVWGLKFERLLVFKLFNHRLAYWKSIGLSTVWYFGREFEYRQSQIATLWGIVEVYIGVIPPFYLQIESLCQAWWWEWAWPVKFVAISHECLQGNGVGMHFMEKWVVCIKLLSVKYIKDSPSTINVLNMIHNKN